MCSGYAVCRLGKVHPPLFAGVFHTLCNVLYGRLAVGAVGTAGEICSLQSNGAQI